MPLEIQLIVLKVNSNHSKSSSVGREVDCREGGRRFDSWDQTNTQGVKELRHVGSAFAL